MTEKTSDDVAKELKKEGILRITGKKDMKPTSVRVLDRNEGPVVIYLFSRSKEITKNDAEVEFTAKIGAFRVTHFFQIKDMVYRGKLAL
jgi:hypothetical protein